MIRRLTVRDGRSGHKSLSFLLLRLLANRKNLSVCNPASLFLADSKHAPAFDSPHPDVLRGSSRPIRRLMVRDGRIELPTSVWKTDIIPFNQSRFRTILTKSKARRKQGTGFGLKLTAFFSYSSSSSSSQSSHSPSIITSPHFLQISSSSILFFYFRQTKTFINNEPKKPT